jgi:hypothetical protein
MKLRKYLLFMILLFTGLRSYSQDTIPEATVTIPYLSFSYEFFVPGGDLADRFGVGNMVGADFYVKLKSNFEIGIGGSYIFGDQVKIDSLLHGMRTSDGEILDDNAIFSQVFFFQRGWSAGITFSKILPVLSPNINSGLKLGIGSGYSQNWVRIENQENTIPQLTDEYKTYYDHKVGGIYIEEFIGFEYFSKRGMANFLAGFEFRQAFNQQLRSYNIDQMKAVSGNSIDLYFGVKVAWNILLREREATGFFYN